jgi:hypothetical protein
LSRWRVLTLAVVLMLALGAGTLAITSNRSSTTAAAAADPVIAAAGDIACDPKNRNYKDGQGTQTACRQMAVSDLLVDAGLTAVLALGDNQYYCGGLDAYQESYGRSWGRVKEITYPAIGNHEYIARDRAKDAGDDPDRATGCDAGNDAAGGYFKYFGAAAGDPARGYYSFDLGAWHLVSLNSNCTKVSGCDVGSEQSRWLRADLAAHPNSCTLAFWHHPHYSSGDHGGEHSVADLWEALYAAGAELVLNGHEHIYERFAPQTPSGTVDTEHGIRQFTVGTGGSNHTKITTVQPNSEVRNDTTFGILKLTLRPAEYAWEFVAEKGKGFTDSGTGRCHGPH